MSLNDGLVFLISPFLLANVWIKMVMPSLTTLLSDSSREMLSDKTPILCAVIFD